VREGGEKELDRQTDRQRDKEKGRQRYRQREESKERQKFFLKTPLPPSFPLSSLPLSPFPYLPPLCLPPSLCLLSFSRFLCMSLSFFVPVLSVTYILGENITGTLLHVLSITVIGFYALFLSHVFQILSITTLSLRIVFVFYFCWVWNKYVIIILLLSANAAKHYKVSGCTHSLPHTLYFKMKGLDCF
jgi:hypothetical protein